jgi:hypothetical protein
MGSLNNPARKIVVGWSRDSGHAVFRIGFGKKQYYNVLRNKTVTVSKYHINIFRGRW